MKKIILVMLIILVHSNVYADNDPHRTDGSFNGRYWRASSESAKAELLVGIFSGIKLIVNTELKLSGDEGYHNYRQTLLDNYSKLFITKLSAEDMRSKINKIYEMNLIESCR